MNWSKLWKDKKFEQDNISLESLLKISGFLEMGVTPDSWSEYGKKISDLVHLNGFESIVEFGCGCCSFLSVFSQKTNKVTGIDISDDLIKISRRVIEHGQFITKNIFDIEIQTNHYDIAICNSIFQYFASDVEAYSIIKKMYDCTKEKGSYLVLLDINDLNKEDEYISHRSKSLGLSIEEYNKRYLNYEHKFYSKSFFEKFADENKMTIHIFDQNIRGYCNNNFRYNVIMKK